MTIQEILQIEDISERIRYIKQARKTPLPNVDQLRADWEPEKHDVMDPEKRPDEIKVISPEERDPLTGKVTKTAITKPEPVNRIPLPLEQDIVNIHTAFTVGTEPNLTCETDDNKEKELFKVIKTIDRKNKVKYLNKRVVRSWLSEKEVAEYWYTVEDKSFWKLILNKIKSVFGIKTNATRKFKCAIWSPFRGDILFPFFDDVNDYKGLGREYKVKQIDGTFITYFQFVDDDNVYLWKQGGASWQDETGYPFKHQFEKNPTIYSWRDKALCEKIRPIRNRLETIISNYGDCIDYNFFPKLVATGGIVGNNPKAARGGLVQLEDGADLKYLSWQQTPEAAKLEIDTLTERAYSLTNTPRISFENLQGLGNAFSGVSFQYAFMGAHMAVEMHAETLGEHLQRRYNFLVSAIGSVNTAYADAAETIDIDVEIVPYMINDIADKIKNASDAVTGGIASRKTGIILAGLVEEDNIEEELEAIEADEKKRNEMVDYPIGLSEEE
ncbi:phage portal protein [Dysgonomonas macrotermitis]|uniref:Phage portal protein, SPP1 family n=1 Tax=Dysgonomonas macrotermitis TaxID=1346286 RepID=A0A1M5IWF2_9BACT|nr:phage portal protein [Dysgonomonas macrotermitis]SHG32634.1 phage portal protein, SPP1 family [Dysgonomonas macrotermitis]